ncbi:MAG: hypothetical protein HY036_06715 [Nitrospirae bacterium]|nr:hypothetical protein [Nitrospirota bacterium]MBI3352253.1 hypothetical protein [Nitrospirota bacterium]
MRQWVKKVILLFFMMMVLTSCSDLFAKQKAIRSVQNYRAGKHSVNFKSWLEERLDSNGETQVVWEAGRIRKGFWVVQITVKMQVDDRRYLYWVDLQTGQIRGADEGISQETLQEFEKSAPEYIYLYSGVRAISLREILRCPRTPRYARSNYDHSQVRHWAKPAVLLS